MLKNPNFEGNFTVRDGQGELVVAEHWHHGYDSSHGHRPEWKPELADVGSGRVYEGYKAQKWFTTFSPHSGWIYQRVEGVEPGKLYRLTAKVYVWSSSEDDPDESERPGKVWIRVGINPWGDNNALALSTQYGTAYVDWYDDWVELEAIVRAKSSALTVFLHSYAEFGAKHNDVYWDDAKLEEFVCGNGNGEPPIEPPIDDECPTIEEIRQVVREEIDATKVQVTLSGASLLERSFGKFKAFLSGAMDRRK